MRMEIAQLSSYHLSVLGACSRLTRCPSNMAAQRRQWRGGKYPGSSGPALRSSWMDGQNDFIKVTSLNRRPEVMEYLVHESLQQRVVVHVLLHRQGTSPRSRHQWKARQPVATVILPVTLRPHLTDLNYPITATDGYKVNRQCFRKSF